MAKKISQLTQATEVKSDDVTVIVQDGETKKLPLNMMVTKQDIENKKIAGLAKLDEIEATYENDTYTPTITVKNKSSVKTGEGDEVDYSANVMDGHAKSAILKGQTVSNLWKELSNVIIVQEQQEGTTIQYDYSEQYAKVTFGEKQVNAATTVGMNTTQQLQGNKTYYINTFVLDGSETTDTFLIRDGFNNVNLHTTVIKEYPTGQILSFTTEAPTSRLLFYYFAYTRKYGGVNYGKPYYMPKRFIVSDKLEDVVNQDFFEGMQSVKMPVLTTTGKNLFDGNFYFRQKYDNNIKNIIDADNRTSVSTVINVKPNTNYYIKPFNKTNTKLRLKGVMFYDENGYYLSETLAYGFDGMFTTPSNCGFITFEVQTNDWSEYTVDELKSQNYQIEQGEQSTTYEPYKSNILTVNEPIELRGIGQGSNRVEDELDCLTGEVTERIGEYQITGEENWDFLPSVRRLQIQNPKFIPNIKCGAFACDKLQAKQMNDDSLHGTNGTYYIGYTSDNWLRIILDENLTSLEQGKEWLKANKPIIQYQLKTESIKTVDLIPSGTHPSTTPYCWKDGHIQLSSSGLLPSLEYSVVTSRAGQINQNATMIVKNDKRIFDLEILLASGLVNTTYQALTLQNQVETGLSKVSLSSETEPDYLLYHMIMKLIEEKAYKLDDLTEKVSVFYLYEKLSDEQFETIYSALYPFVEEEYIELPEDGEIIEEPVVDELPKEVENGVVM